MIRLQKRVEPNMEAPRGYGLAWRDFCRHQAVLYPIPLNVLIGALREAYLWVRFNWMPWDSGMERKMRAEILETHNLDFQFALEYANDQVRWHRSRIAELEVEVAKLRTDRAVLVTLYGRHG